MRNPVVGSYICTDNGTNVSYIVLKAQHGDAELP